MAPSSSDDGSAASGERFLACHRRWVETLADVEVVTGLECGGEGETLEAVVTLLDAFVFVQTLDDCGVLEDRWLQSTWDDCADRRDGAGPEQVLESFLAAVDDLCRQYGVGFFGTDDPLAAIVDRETGPTPGTVRDRLARVLGLDDRRVASDCRGLTEVDYRTIDEDVFGRTHEAYLAARREERGIHYTPGYLSRHVVERTVGRDVDGHVEAVRTAVREGDWAAARTAVDRLTDVRILDPACGAGAFLVAAFHRVRDAYDELLAFLSAERARLVDPDAEGSTAPDERAVEALADLRRRLAGGRSDARGADDPVDVRALSARIVLRHLHGTDVDGRALDVAARTLRLATIRRDPDRYRPGALPDDEGAALPALDVNLVRGDALVGLPGDRARALLEREHADEIAAIRRLRAAYVEAPSAPGNEAWLDERRERVTELRSALDGTFEATLEEGIESAAERGDQSVVDATRPLHWPLAFPHVFDVGGGRVGSSDGGVVEGSDDGGFGAVDDDVTGAPDGAGVDRPGFDCVVGNPPWFVARDEAITRFLGWAYDHQSDRPDLYRFFVERSVELAAGRVGLVTPNTWLSIPAAGDLRRLVLGGSRVEAVAFVPDSAFDGVAQNAVAVAFDRRQPATVDVAAAEQSGEADEESGVADGASGVADGDPAAAGDDSGTAREPSEGIVVGDLDATGTFHRKRTIPPADVRPPAYRVNLYVGRDERAIAGTVARGATPLSAIAETTTGYQLYHTSIHTDRETREEAFHADRPLTDSYVPEVQSDDLHRYHLDVGEERYVDTAATFYRVPDRRFFAGETILLREVPSATEVGLIASIDRESRPFPKSIVSVVLTPDAAETYDAEHLLGLLNSRLLYLQSLVDGEKTGQDLFPRVSQSQLRRLSIRGTDELTPFVREMELATGARHRLAGAWREAADELATGERSLAAIVARDRERTRRGDPGSRWTEGVTFDPEGTDPRLDREYERFVAEAAVDAPELVVYGIEAQREAELYRVRFANRALVATVALSVDALLDSRRRVHTLGDLLSKTEVPVVDPDGSSVAPAATEPPTTADESRVVIDAARRALREWDRWAELGLDEPDVAALDARRRAAQTTLDALVFDLYGLTVAEARTVLNVLELREALTGETLRRFAAARVGRAAVAAQAVDALVEPGTGD